MSLCIVSNCTNLWGTTYKPLNAYVWQGFLVSSINSVLKFGTLGSSQQESQFLLHSCAMWNTLEKLGNYGSSRYRIKVVETKKKNSPTSKFYKIHRSWLTFTSFITAWDTKCFRAKHQEFLALTGRKSPSNSLELRCYLKSGLAPLDRNSEVGFVHIEALL